MGEWHKHQPPDPNHPCTNCQAGSCGVTSEIRDGELWMKSDDCTETCQRYLEYTAKPERILGKHIREAISAIRGG